MNKSSAVLSVSELNRQVRQVLESQIPLLWVGGEISNLTYAASGHVYFSLKDAGAQVRCVMWRNRAQILGWRLENGQQIEARALVSFYEPRGDFQLNIEAVRRAGQGDLFQRFLELKARLENEGLFAAERKRPLPGFPRRIGIVTSPQAAALRDVLTTLARRAPHLVLTLYPTPVQGEGAGSRIADALTVAGADNNDLILLCRGGGSMEDLWAFNDETLARAIVACPVPVISGVGHETDFTIADFAADLRAPTPTAGAELAAPDREGWLDRLDTLDERLTRAMQGKIALGHQRLDWLSSRLLHPAQKIALRRQQAEQLSERLRLAFQRRTEKTHHRLQLAKQSLLTLRPRPVDAAQQLPVLAARLQRAGEQLQARRLTQLEHLAASLRQRDPHAVLNRGYAVARAADGTLLRDATQLSAGAALQVQLARGSLAAQVTKVVPAGEAD
ncbi:MAG TPA: exodeoxyribonuclease VII large subunit [Rhodocyclaceae bacterium]|nr:exodeoxyribonuclease VII large subunit [Rhodocyclaceae bacterium]